MWVFLVLLDTLIWIQFALFIYLFLNKHILILGYASLILSCI